MTDLRTAYRRRLRRARSRGVALVIVLGSLAILAVMLTEFQDETSADLGHALAERDAVRAEYAAKSAVNLSRLLIAAEPTIRNAVAMLVGGAQIPVWEFADQVLGAFNDKAGQALFRSLGGFDLSEGKSLGMEGAGFEVVIIDEDSKINLNAAARNNAYGEQRLVTQLMGLMSGPQFNPLFEERDREGNFHTRQQVCAAIIDWTDWNFDAAACDLSGHRVDTGAEDSYYQMLADPYKRKNAAFDSLQELHLVRGVTDDFWASLIEPKPWDPHSRVVTVWGQDKVNVNTANAQTLLAVVCGNVADPQLVPLCSTAEEQMKFLSVIGLVRAMTAGIPLFRSAKGFQQEIEGNGPMMKMLMEVLQMEPIVGLRGDQLVNAVTTESKVFSIYATGIVTAGKRRTIRRIHSVVDFRSAPAPVDPFQGIEDPSRLSLEEARQRQMATGPEPELPEGATEEALANAFRPDPAGRVIYYRVE